MIVHCTSCQAKFRIADEKIGPRGSKARCSRCRTVFAVHRELGAMPLPDGEPRTPPAIEQPSVTAGRAPLDVELERQERGAPPNVDPFEFSPQDDTPDHAGEVAADPDPFAPAGQSASAAAPFGWALPSGVGDPFRTADPFEASADPFASPPDSGDPFHAAASSSAGPDPFAGGACAEPFGLSAADPFAASEGEAPAFEAAPPWPASPDPAALLAQAAGPFEEAASPVPSRRLPLTDLSDLLGEGSGPSAPLGAPTSAAAAPRAGPDLTLEDGATPPAFRAPAPARDLSLGAPEPIFGGGRALAFESEPAFGFGSPDLELPGQLSPRQRFTPAPAAEPSGPLALATDPTPAPAASAPARPPPLPAAPAPSMLSTLAALDVLSVADAGAAPAPPPARPAAPATSPRRARSLPSLAGLAVNAVALAALLAVALAMLVVWRGGRLEAGAFQPAAIAAALRHGRAGPFVTSEVRSGLYERERGAPLLFVRGDVVSRAQAPVRSVRVAVEVVREGTVVARGEALAGAVPTPEELWRARSADALARVARRAASRAPERIGPGDAVPFLVAIDEYPQELGGTALRMSVVPEAARAR